MANVAKMLMDAMRRVARLEARSVLSETDRTVRDLARTVKELEARLARTEANKPGEANAANATKAAKGDKTSPKSGFSSASVLELRRRLGISQREMAILTGVSTQAVYLWERRGGSLRLRNTTRQILRRLQGMGKRDIGAELAKRG